MKKRSKASSKASADDKNLLLQCYNSGHCAEAERVARRLVAAFPTDPFSLKILGLLLTQSNRSQEALPLLKKAAERSPNDPQLFNLLGNTLQELGHPDAAIARYTKALALKPDFVEAHYNLGNALRGLGRLEAAIEHYATAVQTKDDFFEAHYNLGDTLQELGRLDAAVACYTKALELRPEVVETYYNLGNALKDLGQLDQAVARYATALTLRPDFVEGHYNMGRALQELGDLDAALKHYQEAATLQPDLAAVCNNMGVVLQDLGRFAEAAVCYQKALAIDPDDAEVIYNLGSLAKDALDEEACAALSRMLATPATADANKMFAHFALGKALADKGEDDQAFAHVAQGHRLRQDWNKTRGSVYDPARDQARLAAYQQAITPAFFAERRAWGVPDRTPIFVVGFPRSGTSLVEQILASHSAVQGAGELEDLGRLADAASLFASPEQACRDLARLTPETARSLAARYLGKLQAVSGGRTRVVDKMPHNFQDLWLIALLFPNAVILHCVRSPEDTCLSCFLTKFAKGYAYTDDLVALGRHYQYYRDVMDLWKAVIPMAARIRAGSSGVSRSRTPTSTAPAPWKAVPRYTGRQASRGTIRTAPVSGQYASTASTTS